jgi:1,4-alpha-glucan branching enzyme
LKSERNLLALDDTIDVARKGSEKEPSGAAAEVRALMRAEHSDPFHFLGPHRIESNGQPALAIRIFRPHAVEVTVAWNDPALLFPANSIHPDGVFEAIIPLRAIQNTAETIAATAYQVRIRFEDGQFVEEYDTYAFPPVLSDFDLHLIGEGTHYRNYEKLGAHLREIEGVRGVHFGVWAPNALRVSVVGNFNFWDGRVNPMRSRDSSGIWEIFVPGLDEGMIYKFEVRSRIGNYLALKADPYGFSAEVRPKSGSVVCNIDTYQWNDSGWMKERGRRDWFQSPISIYELHLGSWRRTTDGRWLTYRQLADELIPYVKKMGFSHIEMLPVMEHPFDASWGYQTLGYFAVTSRFGSPQDFMYLVDRCHQEGLGVLLDWTPAHFPRDGHGLGFFDGTHLYEHADPRLGEHPDWGTLVFNYGRNEVQNFLLSNALFWLDKYHLDGLRVDAVASMLYLDYSRKQGEWIPNEFGGRENLQAIALIRRLNEVAHLQHPGVLMIAEESTAWPAVSRPTYVGGLGFDLKWNMGWMNDTLRYFALDPIHRKYHHNEVTFSMIYAFTENFLLPLSHDEVVHGKRALLAKMPGDDWQKFANVRLLFSYMYAHPGKKMLFMGSELAPWNEWWQDISLDWGLLKHKQHLGIQRLVMDLNRVYAGEPALHEVDFDWQGFEWLDANDADTSVLSFLRRARNTGDFVVAICNFTPVVRENYRVGVPELGLYREILNSDSEFYDGTNVGNAGLVAADPVPWNGRAYSLKLTLPPLAAIYFKPHHS